MTRKTASREARDVAAGYPRNNFARRRAMIFCDRYGWECYWCSRPLDRQSLTADHLAPKGDPMRGVLDVVPSCYGCNIDRGHEDAATWRTLRQSLRGTMHTPPRRIPGFMPSSPVLDGHLAFTQDVGSSTLPGGSE